MEAWQSVSVSLVIVCAIIASCYVAYEKGALDPVIEQISIMMVKAKVKAAREKYQAQGLQAGGELIDSQLRGSIQTTGVISDVEPIGGVGGAKKLLQSSKM